eukprot:13224539-Ditylum_brightwellii.AAC.1
MVLSKDEFRNQVLIYYAIMPKDLPNVCDGCGNQHSLQHALQCKIGGLIGGQHNKVQDDLGLVGTQAIPPPHTVCNIPRVPSSWDGKGKGGVPVDYQARGNKDKEVCVIKKKDK